MFTPAIGGAEQQLHDLIRHLDPKFYDITLFYEPWNAFEEFLELRQHPHVKKAPIHIYACNRFTQRIVHLPRFLRQVYHLANMCIGQFAVILPNFIQLKSVFRNSSIEVLHIINGGYPGSMAAKLAAVAAKSAGISACVMTIASTPQRLQWPQKIVEYSICRQVEKSLDYFVGVARHVGQTLTRLYDIPSKKIKIIYYGIETDSGTKSGAARRSEISARFGIPLDRTVIAVIARLSPEKGHELFLHALKKLIPDFSKKISVLLIGDGPLNNQLRKQVSDHGLQNVVIFTGHLNNTDVKEALVRVDIVAIPSKIEGLPYAVTEAMSMSKPVVGSMVGGIPEQVIDSETGFLVPPNDANAFAKALSAMIDDPQMAMQMGENARRRFERLFKLDQMIHKYSDLYRSV